MSKGIRRGRKVWRMEAEKVGRKDGKDERKGR